jgi:hypothetical protein
LAFVSAFLSRALAGGLLAGLLGLRDMKPALSPNLSLFSHISAEISPNLLSNSMGFGALPDTSDIILPKLGIRMTNTTQISKSITMELAGWAVLLDTNIPNRMKIERYRKDKSTMVRIFNQSNPLMTAMLEETTIIRLTSRPIIKGMPMVNIALRYLPKSTSYLGMVFDSI